MTEILDSKADPGLSRGNNSVARRDIGFGRSVTYDQIQYIWDVRFGFPIGSFDNGWGLSQQTDANNHIIQFARWRANVVEGWRELTVTKIGEARNYIRNSLYPGVAVENIPIDHICKEVVARYNGGHYYIRSNGSVDPDTQGGNTEYIDSVEPFRNRFAQ